MPNETISIPVRFRPETVEKLDELIQKEKFSSRASIIRRAVSEFLDKEFRPIRA